MTACVSKRGFGALLCGTPPKTTVTMTMTITTVMNKDSMHVERHLTGHLCIADSQALEGLALIPAGRQAVSDRAVDDRQQVRPQRPLVPFCIYGEQGLLPVLVLLCLHGHWL